MICVIARRRAPGIPALPWRSVPSFAGPHLDRAARHQLDKGNMRSVARPLS